MSGVNVQVIVGHLGRDPEMRYLPSGKPVTSFSVAVSRRWKDKATDQFREETEWFNVNAFDRLAEIVNEYGAKGKLVYVQGRTKTDESQDPKTGEKRYFRKVIATEVQFLGKKDEDGEKSSDDNGTFFPF